MSDSGEMADRVNRMTTTTLSLTDPLRQFAVAVRLPEVVPKDALEVGLAHIEAELERIALDAYAANRRGAPLSDAVVDFANYPHLARVHAFVDDILTLSLPAEVVDWVESLLSMPEPPSWEG